MNTPALEGIVYIPALIHHLTYYVMDKVFNNISSPYSDQAVEEMYEQLRIIGIESRSNLRDLFFQSERTGVEQEEVFCSFSCRYCSSSSTVDCGKELIALYPAFLANIYTPQAETLLKELGDYFQKYITPRLQ